MQRRDFLKYSAVTGTAMMFPQLATSNEFTKMVKTAWYCSKLNPVRFVAGLVFDEIAEVYLKPLAIDIYHDFINGRKVSKTQLSYYTNSSSIKTKVIEYEPYKASVAVYGVADYELYKKEERRLALKREPDLQRFGQIQQYLKDEKVELKLYDWETPFIVGNDLEPNDLFNIDYISLGNNEKVINAKYAKLLEVTNNSSFKGFVV